MKRQKDAAAVVPVEVDPQEFLELLNDELQQRGDQLGYQEVLCFCFPFFSVS